MFQKLEDLFDLCRRRGTMRVAVVCPYGPDVLEGIAEAHRRGMAAGVLVGERAKIAARAEALGLDLSDMDFIEAASDAEAVENAVRLVSSGGADLLMKGLVKTAALLKGVLNKEWGLRTGALLSHLAIVQPPVLGRPLGVTDGGMNMYPDLAAKAGIISNAVRCYQALGVENPKVAVLTAVEVVNPDMPATLDAAALTAMNRRGQIPGCVDGPFALDNAVSAEAARIKGISSPVAGQADILLVPNIEAGNFVGKAAMFMGRSPCAGVLLGARKPVVMTSRFDSMESKLLSIALGAAVAGE